MVVGLELMRERVVRETERRLAGDLLAEALGGRLDSDELRGRLRPFGIGAEAAVLVFERRGRPRRRAGPGAGAGRRGRSAPGGHQRRGGRPLLCAVIDARAGDPVEVAGRAARGARRTHGRGARRRQPRRRRSESLRRSLPRGALRARGDRALQRRRARGRHLPRPRRLPAPALAPGRRGAALYCDSVLGPHRERRGRVRRRADPLAGGVPRAQRPVGEGGTRALLPPAHAALPDPARRAAHRAATSRSARDRIEFWLALRARELVR